MKVKLGDVCEKASSNIKQSDIPSNKGVYPIYGASGLLGKVNFFHQEKPYIAVIKDGAGIGRAILCPEKSSVIGTLQYLLPRDNVLPQYLYYVICHMHLEKYFTGATIPHIYFKDYKNEPFNLVSRDEQQRIINVLGLVENIIDARKKEIVELDNLVKSRFVEMFGDPSANTKRWKIQRLDEFSENLDFRRKPITASERVKGKYPYYGASGIVDYVEDYIFDDNILLISEDGANLLMRSSPVAFSVHGKVWVNNHAHVYKFTNMCIQKYIEIYFSMIDISDQITGSAQPKLNQAKLNAMKFAIPDKIYLDRYYKFVCHIDKSKLAVQKSLEELETLKNSLMQQYFD